VADDLDELAGLLRERGLRVTASRVAVLHEIRAMDGHPDAEAVRTAVARRLGSVSTQAVYDILHTLTKAGLLRSIEPAGHPARYETRVGDNHHHLVCRGCGATRDVDCAAGHTPCLEPSGHAGFVIDEAEVIFWGLCADCHHAHPTDNGHA
jgi:Fur family ferric uptake transcriptional regulator